MILLFIINTLIIQHVEIVTVECKIHMIINNLEYIFKFYLYSNNIFDIYSTSICDDINNQNAIDFRYNGCCIFENIITFNTTNLPTQTTECNIIPQTF